MTGRIAFYAPLKPPGHPVPSGDRRMARALLDALARRGYEVEVASRLRSFDRDGDDARQRRIERLGGRIAQRLIERYRAMAASARPRAWVTYHPYHKSPDWLGPRVCEALAIPYLVIETSFAPKQAGGPWDRGHRVTEQAIRRADLTLALTQRDTACLAPLIEKPAELRRFPPFLDARPFLRAAPLRDRHRTTLIARFGLDPTHPWLLTVGMMRADVKFQSYDLLAQALDRIRDRPWQLVIVGDGAARLLVEKCFESFGPKRVIFAGILGESELVPCYAAADVYAWPAVQEAYGLALLEAQASGLPVVAGREGGVADVVRDDVTGILTPPRNSKAFALAIADLLDHPGKRRRMAAAARDFVERERSSDRASKMLDRALVDARTIFEARRRRRDPDHSCCRTTKVAWAE